MTVSYEITYCTRMEFFGAREGEGCVLSVTGITGNLSDAMDKARRLIIDWALDSLDCVDAYTGEILFIARAEREEEREDEE